MLRLLVEADFPDARGHGAEDESEGVIDPHARQHLFEVTLSGAPQRYKS